MILTCDQCHGLVDSSSVWLVWKKGTPWPCKRYETRLGAQYSGVCVDTDELPDRMFSSYRQAKAFRKRLGRPDEHRIIFARYFSVEDQCRCPRVYVAHP